MHAAAASQQPERELARPRAAARPWPRSPTVAHPAHALRQSLAHPLVARVSTQQRLRLTAEKRAWPRASTDALPLRVKAEGFGYLHLRHDRGMPRKVRIPQSPPRMARNSRRAPTFEASLELTHRSWPWLLALLGRLSIKATRRTCRGSQTRALWRLSPPPCSPCLPRLRHACLRPLTCLFVFCCCCISVLNCFSRCARVGPGGCGAVVPQARGTETAIAAAQ